LRQAAIPLAHFIMFNISNSLAVSSPGLTGRSSISEKAVLIREVSGILDARFRGHDMVEAKP
jgi:hypothetical protein